MAIDFNMTFREILSQPCFAQMQGQFISVASGDWFKDKYDMTLSQHQEQSPTWAARDMFYGLQRLEQIANEREQYVYQLSTGAKLIYMPAKEKTCNTYGLIMAGGGYTAVCTLAEGLPIAAKLNELGMDCFCLNYRTIANNAYFKGLMPKPLDDTAEALRFIKENEAAFGLDASDYIAGGFSAGGHLAAMWGTAHKGARSYGLPSPKLLLLGYPLISLENLPKIVIPLMQSGMIGFGTGKKERHEYAAHRHIDADYPAVYLCQAEDDKTVPAKDSHDIESALKAAGVRYIAERVATGGHGFGLGTETPANGWLERAVEFLHSL